MYNITNIYDIVSQLDETMSYFEYHRNDITENNIYEFEIDNTIYKLVFGQINRKATLKKHSFLCFYKTLIVVDDDDVAYALYTELNKLYYYIRQYRVNYIKNIKNNDKLKRKIKISKLL